MSVLTARTHACTNHVDIKLHTLRLTTESKQQTNKNIFIHHKYSDHKFILSPLRCWVADEANDGMTESGLVSGLVRTNTLDLQSVYMMLMASARKDVPPSIF